jgi:hypothetical protein
MHTDRRKAEVRECNELPSADSSKIPVWMVDGTVRLCSSSKDRASLAPLKA